ncbi:50S ribosomal protein L29 [Buchnera aphidicola (Taiwanaphis decaspermi)]|uniref:50S ribosomal protein L29 n=1 Tax=Buchnera aphidicola TaxID=9 RepID=UPI0031B85ECD
MKKNKINDKNYELINTKLKKLLREKFNLKIQHNARKLEKTHLLKTVRRKIARLKTFLHKNN